MLNFIAYFGLLWLGSGLSLAGFLVDPTFLDLDKSKELEIVLNLYFRAFSNGFRPYSVSELPLKVHKARVALSHPIEALTLVDAVIRVFGVFREG